MSENVVNTDKPKVLFCHKNSLASDVVEEMVQGFKSFETN